MNQEDITPVLEEYIGWLSDEDMQLGGLDGADWLALVPFYRALAQLASRKPLFPIDFREAIAALSDGPLLLKELAEQAQSAFELQQPPSNMEGPLSNFEQFCGMESRRFLPESKLLAKVARLWRDRLAYMRQAGLRSASLQIEIVPSLDIKRYEERTTPDGIREVYLPIRIVNVGEVPAVNIRLYLELKNARLMDTKSMEDRNAGLWVTTALPQSWLDPGASQVVSIGVTHSQQARLTIWPEYFDIFSQRTSQEHPENAYRYELQVRTKLNNEPMNPYTINTAPPDDIFLGQHRRTVEQIATVRSIEMGNLWVVRGLTQTGKTSILLRLCARMASDDRLLPIYVDMYLWWRSTLDAAKVTQDEATPGTGMQILYKFAGYVQAELALLKVKDGDVDDYYKRFERDKAMDFNELATYLRLVKERTGKQPVYLLDELDHWRTDDGFRRQAEALTVHLADLVRKGACTVVLAVQWSALEWLTEHIQGTLDPIIENVQFLGRDDVRLLATTPVEVNYSELAIETIWRMTGGWPGLAQLVLHEIMRQLIGEFAETGQRSLLVDGRDVKRAVDEVLESSRYETYVSYYVQGLAEDDRNKRAYLHAKEKVDPLTGHLLGMHQIPRAVHMQDDMRQSSKDDDLADALRILKEKSIIECDPQARDTCRLRPGMLFHLHS